MKITTHTVVKNEENWIWYSLMSVKDLVSEMFVIDDSSTDKTVEIIKTIKDPKIKLFEKKLLTPDDHTKARNELLEKTKTDWFIILDGDEVWNTETFKKLLEFLDDQPKEIYGVAMRTRNVVGDIYHYLPESTGNYRILGRKGHLTIRAYRNLAGFSWQGDYPLEAFTDKEGKSVNDQDGHLKFFDNFYWHMTNLQRSSSDNSVKGWRKKRLELGVKANKDFPEVFFLDRPSIVPDPWKKMSVTDLTKAALLTPVKRLRRILKNN